MRQEGGNQNQQPYTGNNSIYKSKNLKVHFKIVCTEELSSDIKMVFMNIITVQPVPVPLELPVSRHRQLIAVNY